MLHHVIVSFGGDRGCDYRFAAGEIQTLSAEEARRWFDREFVALQCGVPSPLGKELLVDLVPTVAQTAGKQRLRGEPEWGEPFARHAASLLGRSVVRVDVARRTIDC